MKIKIFLLFILLLFLTGCTGTKPGIVKGLVTWQYNDIIGTKPDVGADINSK